MTISAAQRYAESGLYVLPIHSMDGDNCTCGPGCTEPAKHPLIRNGVNGATRDPKLIEYWWKIWPDCNVAIATGNGIAVMDVDDPKVVDLSKIETRVASTAHGYHAYYRVDRKVKNRTGVRPGIDIRGDGGYVIAPPSMHETGVVYQWFNRQPASFAPQWFYDLCQDKPQHRSKYNGESKAFNVEWVKAIEEGGRNNQLYRIAQAANAKGKDRALIEGEVWWINRNRCKPPLPDREVEKLLRSALG